MNQYNCNHKWEAKPRVRHTMIQGLNMEYPSEIEVYCIRGCGLYCWLPMPPIENLEVEKNP